MVGVTGEVVIDDLRLGEVRNRSRVPAELSIVADGGSHVRLLASDGGVETAGLDVPFLTTAARAIGTLTPADVQRLVNTWSETMAAPVCGAPTACCVLYSTSLSNET